MNLGKGERHMQASLTLEASFVLLILLFFLMTISFIGIYLHDICYLSFSAQYYANRVAEELVQDTEDGVIDWTVWEKKSLGEAMSKRFSKRESHFLEQIHRTAGQGLLFPVTELDCRLRMREDRIIVTYTMQYRFPLFGLFQRVTKRSSIPVFVKAEALIHSESDLLRRLQSVFHVIDP